MIRACTRPNLLEWPARPPALIPEKVVEAFLQCFGGAEKSTNRKNSNSNGLIGQIVDSCSKIPTCMHVCACVCVVYVYVHT